MGSSRRGRPSPPAIVEPMVAGTRDASWYNRPDVRSVKVLHIATVADSAACAPGPEHQRAIPLDPTYLPAERVYDDLRCRRPGCRVRWAKVPARPRSRPTVTVHLPAEDVTP